MVAIHALIALAAATTFATESDYYRILSVYQSPATLDSRAKHWMPAPFDLALEVSGLAPLDDGKLAVAIRKGEIWILSNVYDDPPQKVEYRRFASGLHEPLGLARKGDAFYVTQRGELTKIRDSDGDGEADEYLTLADDWSVSGNYHEYAYGPLFDRDGNLWVTLNIGLGLDSEQRKRIAPFIKPGGKFSPQGAWRGWGMKLGADGVLSPVCVGFRSPCGIGMNAEGEVFASEQQGNWWPTCALLHLREGAFFGNPEGLASAGLPDSPIKAPGDLPSGRPYPEAWRKLPLLTPPAVWFPYKKMGQSATDVVCDQTGGAFGPFENQLFVGEFTLSSIHRVYLEKIDGAWQGACFPFRDRLSSAVLRLAFGKDGSLFAGLTNRGWSSIGSASYGLERLVWTGKTPFEIKEMKAEHDGFTLTFTLPIDEKAASDPASYKLSSFTYLYHGEYGSPEILGETLPIHAADVAPDRLSVRLRCSGLREYFVHELHAPDLRSATGVPLLHDAAYYTLNRIPKR